ncbi:MAG TPA: DNA-formamidopyrimidine glycosylase family protein [Acidimicrobiales bacterium]|nr:DNA-formamidopyrimidine glycosylase family protein [Acidimicrobiales bacterium]
MPELPEVEAYRQLAEGALGRPVERAVFGDRRFARGSSSPRHLVAALAGVSFTAARRHGKLLVLDTDGPDGAPHLGLRFGMTGRLLVDGRAGVERLIYSSEREEAKWDRFTVVFKDGGRMVVRDPRLLGGVELDPTESALGPDALGVTAGELRRALEHSVVALKARLLDQHRLAGVGNLIADEVLWRASLAPHRRSGSLTPAELRRLHRHLHLTLDELIRRGGSHLGDLMPERRFGGHCPRDGTELVRSTVGGRTSWWCPRHQH